MLINHETSHGGQWARIGGDVMRVIQFEDNSGDRHLAAEINGGGFQIVEDTDTVYALCNLSIRTGTPLAAILEEKTGNIAVPYETLLHEKRILSPIDHPDPAHLHITGTGLTHLGSADTRDRMHKEAQDSAELTDSMKMFNMGLENGKPNPGEPGIQPEWFYKGNGYTLVAPEHNLPLPAFATDGGEEPEIAGIYIIGDNGMPHRIGFTLGNEYSDHVMERVNYLWLAPSKIRACSVGPELLTGALPHDIKGTSRILRNGETLWEKPFTSGEANMSHTISNLEFHHFKYPIFRQPGDIHIHFFGTATLSFADNIRPQDGDVFEIDCASFGHPLRNTLRAAEDENIQIKSL